MKYKGYPIKAENIKATINKIEGPLDQYQLREGQVLEAEAVDRIQQQSSTNEHGVATHENAESLLPIRPKLHRKYKILGRLSTRESYGYSYLACELEDKPLDTDQKTSKRNVVEGELVFIKTPRIDRTLPTKKVENILADIEKSFRNEWQNKDRIAQLNADGLKVAAEILGKGSFEVPDERGADRVVEVPFLISEFINERNMEDFFLHYSRENYVSGDKIKNFSGISDPKRWFQLAEEIIHIIRRVHNRHIIHGNIVPKNILLQEQGELIRPILVDFGQSFLLDVTSITGGSEVRTESPYVAPECRVGNQGWYTPADIYSLGGVLYYLSTGTKPPDIKGNPDIFKTNDSWAFRNQDQVDAWKDLIYAGFSKNDGLMNKNEGIVKVIDKCLRTRPSDRYSSIEKLLHGLSAMNYAKRQKRQGPEAYSGISQAIANLGSLWEGFQDKDWDDVFGSIIRDKIDILEKEVQDMHKGHFEIYAEREDLIDTLVKYIGVLAENDVYATVTVPEYWTEENLGINGRFLTVNKDLARNGVFVNRLFLLAPEDLEPKSEARKILKAHVKAWQDLSKKGHQATSPNLGEHQTPDGKGIMYLGGLLLADKDEACKIQEDLEHVALWRRAEKAGLKEKLMSITFVIRPDYEVGERDFWQLGGQIVKVRFRELESSYGNYEFDELEKHFHDKGVRLLSDILKDAEPEPD